MPRKYLTKFDEDGKQCKRTIQHLRNHPECGVLFYEDKPFKPPKPKPPTPTPKPTPTPDPPTPTPDPPTPTPDPPTPTPTPTPTPSPSPFTPLILPQDYTNQQIPYVIGGGLVADQARPHIDNLIEKANQNLTMPKLKGYRKLSENEAPKPIMREIEMENLIQSERQRVLAIPDEPPQNIADDELTDFQIRKMGGDPITESGYTESEERMFEEEAQGQLRELKKSELYKDKFYSQDEGFELTAIQPLDEVTAVTEEVTRMVGGKSKQGLTTTQKDIIVQRMTDKNISPSRTEEILRDTKLYEEVGGVSQEEENLARDVRRNLQKGEGSSSDPIDSDLVPDDKLITDMQTLLPRKVTAEPKPTIIERAKRIFAQEAYSKLPLAEPMIPIVEETEMQDMIPKTNPEEATGEGVFAGRDTPAEEAKARSDRGMKPVGKPYVVFQNEFEEFDKLTAQGEDMPTRSSFLRRASRKTYNPLENEFETEPTTEPTSISSSRSYRPSLGTTARASATGVAGVAGGYGTVRGLQEMGVSNRWALAAAGGVGGDMSTRILAMAGNAAIRGSTSSAAMVASRSATTAITAGLRGAAEGGVIGAAAGIALMPLGDYFAHQFARTNMSITEQSTATAATTGAVGAGLMTGGLFALGAAPETLGFSAIAGLASIGAGAAIGFFEGQSAERDARRARDRQRDETNATTAARARLIATLPQHNYDIDEAWTAFTQNDDRAALREYEQSFSDLIRSQAAMYGRTSTIANLMPPLPPAPVTPESQNLNDIYSRYVRYQVAQQACAGGQDCGDLANATLPNPFELAHINGQTNSTWQAQADMQVQSIMHQATFHREEIATAQNQIYGAWNSRAAIGRRTMDMLATNPSWDHVLELANQDPNFSETYNQAIRLDAQQQIVDAFRTGQRIEDMPETIRNTALLDPEFGTEINNYYNYVESSARNSGITPAQFQSLQDIEDDTERQAALQRMAVNTRFQDQQRKEIRSGVSKQIKVIDTEATTRETKINSLGEYHKEVVTPANRRSLISGGRDDLLHYHSNNLYAQQALNDDVDPHHIYDLDEEELDAIEEEKDTEEVQMQQEEEEEEAVEAAEPDIEVAQPKQSTQADLDAIASQSQATPDN